MPLVPTAALLAAARTARTGAAAFNVLHLESAEALVTAAERTGLPLILAVSENCLRYHGSLRPLLSAVLALAEGSPARIGVHLDHLTSAALVREGVAAGVRSVMYDASALPYAQNLAATAELAAWCRERGVHVEAELGEIGGKDGVHAPGARTDPGEAAEFVAATGVDALAVAVGTSHAMHRRTAALDLDRIRALAAALPVPLVLHGSSGVPDAALRDAITAGITKVNLSTRLVQAFTARARTALTERPDLVDSRIWLGEAREALAQEAEHLLQVVAG